MGRRHAEPVTLTAHHHCEFREMLDRVGNKWSLLGARARGVASDELGVDQGRTRDLRSALADSQGVVSAVGITTHDSLEHPL